MEGLFCLCRRREDDELEVYQGDHEWIRLPTPPTPVCDRYRILCCDSKLLLLPHREGHIYVYTPGEVEWQRKSKMPSKNSVVAVADRTSKKIYIYAGVATDDADWHEGMGHVYDMETDTWEPIPFQNGAIGLVFHMFLRSGKLCILTSKGYYLLDLDSMSWSEIEKHRVEEGLHLSDTVEYALLDWIPHKYDFVENVMVPLQFECETGTNPTEYGPSEAEIFLVHGDGGKSTMYVLFWSHHGFKKELWKCVIQDDAVVEWWEAIPLPMNCFQVCHLVAGDDIEDRGSLCGCGGMYDGETDEEN